MFSHCFIVHWFAGVAAYMAADAETASSHTLFLKLRMSLLIIKYMFFAFIFGKKPSQKSYGN